MWQKFLFELSIDNLLWTILFMKWKRCDLYAIKQAYILCAVLCKFSIDYRCGFISYSLVNLIKNRFAGFLWEDVVAESNVLKQLWRTFYLHTLFFLNSIPIIIWENFEFQLLGARSLIAIKHWPIYRTIRGFLGG